MAAPHPFTPLAALDFVALDTETTGLDAATARLLQIGALHAGPGAAVLEGEAGSAGGQAVPGGEGGPAAGRFETLVDPGEPIPPASTAIHGITDADITGAPAAATALPQLAAFLGDSVIVGHTIGYDLEILRREADRAGIEWTAPPALDIRPLAQAALDGLAGYDLDALCAGLGIDIAGRHTATGDAAAAARVFAALLPRLHARGIRTLGEAQALSQRIWQREGAQALAVEPVGEPHIAPGRIDSWPYRHRIAEVMASPPVILDAAATLGTALGVLIERGVSSVFVTADGSDDAEAAGIVTERDLLRALHAHGVAMLDAPLGDFRSTPLALVADSDLVYRAIGRMDRLGIRHLGVADAAGRLVGAVTTRNLLRHRGTAAMILGDETAAGEDVAALAAAWGRVPEMARRLADESVDARLTAGVVSAEIRTLTGRAAELAGAAAGADAFPGRFAVLVLGSAGRGESLLAADQDNAIVFDVPAGDEAAADARLSELGAAMADSLDAVGIPYCNGGVMAREPAWRQPLAGWREKIDGWIRRQRPEDLLNVDIFFDAAAVHGDAALAEELRTYALARARSTPSFLVALSLSLRDWRSPLASFGGFRTGADDRVDLKAGGLMPLFSAARILAIKAGSPARATPDRLRAAAEAGLASASQLDGLIDAHGVILDAILRQQIADAEAGIRPGNRVAPAAILSKAERTILRDALRAVPGAIDLVREGML